MRQHSLARIEKNGKILGIGEAITVILQSAVLTDEQKVSLYKELAEKRDAIREEKR